MFLLDTNVVSELRRAERANAHVRAWAEAATMATCAISVVTVLELERGVLLMERRDAKQGAVLRRWLDADVVEQFQERMLDVDTAVARRCAQLHIPDPRPERDALIAATALVHGLTIVTRNRADFEPTGVVIINPWDAG